MARVQAGCISHSAAPFSFAIACRRALSGTLWAHYLRAARRGRAHEQRAAGQGTWAPGLRLGAPDVVMRGPQQRQERTIGSAIRQASSRSEMGVPGRPQ